MLLMVLRPKALLLTVILKIAPFAGVDIYNATNNTMFIGGNLINNSNDGLPAKYGGWAGSNARFYRDANNKIDITFFGPNSSSVTNNPALSPTPNTILWQSYGKQRNFAGHNPNNGYWRRINHPNRQLANAAKWYFALYPHG